MRFVEYLGLCISDPWTVRENPQINSCSAKGEDGTTKSIVAPLDYRVRTSPLLHASPLARGADPYPIRGPPCGINAVYCCQRMAAVSASHERARTPVPAPPCRTDRGLTHHFNST